MKIQNRILHPTYKEDTYKKYKYDSDFYYNECFAGLLYDKWMKIFLDNGIEYENKPDIIKFKDYESYTPFTYKFTFNFPLIDDDPYNFTNYHMKESDYKLFAKLFFTPGWKDELKYQVDYYKNKLNYYQFKIQKPDPRYSEQYGDMIVHVKPWIIVHVKPWIDYLT